MVENVQRRGSMFDPESFEEESEDLGSYQYLKLAASACEEGPPKKKSDSNNSYRLQPTVEIKRDKIVNIIKKAFDNNLLEQKYDSHFMKIQAMELASQIRKDLKALRYYRYRYICIVNIGERMGQDVDIVSRFLWNPEHDHFASYTYKNCSLFATGIVFAVYKV